MPPSASGSFRLAGIALFALAACAGPELWDAPREISGPGETDLNCWFTPREDLFGLNVSYAQPEYLDDAEDLGSRWLRIELHGDGDVEEWIAHYRSVIASAHRRRMKVLAIVDYATVPGKPAWHADGQEWSAYRDRFAEGIVPWAEALGSNIDAWEVWNEPDHQLDGYDPGVPPDQFGLLLAEAASIIRPRSDGLLIVGGLATSRYDYLAAVSETMTQDTGASLDQHYDGLGLHAYAAPIFVQQGNQTVLAEQYSIELAMTSLRDRVAGFTAQVDLPIWLTEAGAPANATTQYLAAAFVDALYARDALDEVGPIRHISYFSWSDLVGFPGEAYGLVHGNGERKPAFWRYQEHSPPPSGENRCRGPRPI